ncbi:MAG: hypothetical protein ABWY55_12820 [Microbacterium sp.]
MTSTSSTAGTDAAAPAPEQDERRRLFRVAGFGGIGAFVAWAVQPIVVSVFSPLVPEGGPDFAYIESTPYNGVLEATVFAGVGVGLLFMVTAVGRLIHPSSTAARAGQTMGLVGASVWFLVAGGSLGQYTSVGWWLSDAAPDPDLQQALYQTLGIVMTGTLVTFAVGMIGWLILLATAGRRARVVGWPLAIVAFAAAAVSAGTFLFPFAPPWGSIASIVAALVVGIAFLVKARRAR